MVRTRGRASRLAPVGVPWEPPALDWQVAETICVNGRHLVPGTEVSITGERGRFRFVRHVRRPDGTEWLDFVGGRPGVERARSFRPDRIKTVHRLAKMRAASAVSDRR